MVWVRAIRPAILALIDKGSIVVRMTGRRKLWDTGLTEALSVCCKGEYVAPGEDEFSWL
jgi:hypothetical protein